MKTSGQRISTKGRVACRTVIEDWMIPFAAYAAADTPSAFQWTGQPPEIAPSHEVISTASIVVWANSLTQALKSRQDSPCAQQTDWHTDRPR